MVVRKVFLFIKNIRKKLVKTQRKKAQHLPKNRHISANNGENIEKHQNLRLKIDIQIFSNKQPGGNIDLLSIRKKHQK